MFIFRPIGWIFGATSASNGASAGQLAAAMRLFACAEKEVLAGQNVRGGVLAALTRAIQSETDPSILACRVSQVFAHWKQGAFDAVRQDDALRRDLEAAIGMAADQYMLLRGQAPAMQGPARTGQKDANPKDLSVLQNIAANCDPLRLQLMRRFLEKHPLGYCPKRAEAAVYCCARIIELREETVSKKTPGIGASNPRSIGSSFSADTSEHASQCRDLVLYRPVPLHRSVLTDDRVATKRVPRVYSFAENALVQPSTNLRDVTEREHVTHGLEDEGPSASKQSGLESGPDRTGDDGQGGAADTPVDGLEPSPRGHTPPSSHPNTRGPCVRARFEVAQRKAICWYVDQPDWWTVLAARSRRPYACLLSNGPRLLIEADPVAACAKPIDKDLASGNRDGAAANGESNAQAWNVRRWRKARILCSRIAVFFLSFARSIQSFCKHLWRARDAKAQSVGS